MTTPAAKATGIDRGGPGSESACTALDKRRTKWLAAGQVAAEADGALAVLDQQLAANAAKRAADKAELKAAAKRMVELKREIKSLAKQRDQLSTDRTHAKRGVAKSHRRAKATEARFDRALLKDLLRKAKSADLAANAPAAVDRGGPGTQESSSATGTRQRRPTPASRRRGSPAAPARQRAASANGRSAAR